MYTWRWFCVIQELDSQLFMYARLAIAGFGWIRRSLPAALSRHQSKLNLQFQKGNLIRRLCFMVPGALQSRRSAEAASPRSKTAGRPRYNLRWNT